METFPKFVEILGRHSWKVFLPFLLIGGIARVFIMKDPYFNGDQLMIYSVGAAFLLAVDRFRNKWISNYLRQAESQEFFCTIFPIATLSVFMTFQLVPFFCLQVGTAMAVLGWYQFYELDTRALAILSLTPLSHTPMRALTLVVWSSLGSLFLLLAVRLLCPRLGVAKEK